VFVFEEMRLNPNADLFSASQTFFLSWPALFLAFFMLTEPFTLPGTKKLQVGYGALVGFLSSTAIFVPFFAMTPELALVIGNLLFFPATLKQKLYLEFVEKKLVADNTWEFIFNKPTSMTFTAGQYLEWTVPHKKQDNRGQRRYFTIASAPEESILRLALRIEEKGSTYKQELMNLQPGEYIIASQLAGDFILPPDPDKKVSLVAGGIGVTPFLSHLGHLEAAMKQTSVTLYFCNRTSQDIAYAERFKKLEETLNFKLVHVLANEDNPLYETGYINAEMIKRHNPDYLERYWYLSGPPRMVDSYSQLLGELKVPSRQIKKDFFPGLA
jgi:ferredoxin-NADP reductase